MAISQHPAGFWKGFLQNRNCLPEIAPQGHFLALRAQGAAAPLGPRNDKSRVFTVLTIACTNRKRYAGSGCPLPYRVRAVVSPQSTRSNTIGYSEPNTPPQSPLSSSCGGVR